MTNDQINGFLEELKVKVLSAKFIVRDLQNGKKFIFYNKLLYNRKCTQISFVVNNYDDEVKINFIYWPRYWAKVKFTRSFNLSSPFFTDWLQSQIKDANIHLNSPNGFPRLYLN